MGTGERLGVNIHVDQLMDGIANNCGTLERLELRWDPDNLRFSDKSQKAIDIIRVKVSTHELLYIGDFGRGVASFFALWWLVSI